MPTWPGAVPDNGLIAGYSERTEDNVARFQPEVGPAKLRRRSSVPTTVLQFSQIMTFVAYDALVTFYQTDLKDGTLSFTRNHPRTGISGTFLFMVPPSLAPASSALAAVSLQLRELV